MLIANVEVIDLKLKEYYIIVAYTHMYTVLFYAIAISNSHRVCPLYPYSWVLSVTIVITTYMKSLEPECYNSKQGVIYIMHTSR